MVYTLERGCVTKAAPLEPKKNLTVVATVQSEEGSTEMALGQILYNLYNNDVWKVRKDGTCKDQLMQFIKE